MRQIKLADIKTLEELIYKTVKVTTIDDEIYEGEFDSFIHQLDSADGLEYIGLEYDGRLVSFTKQDIKLIEEFELTDLSQVVKLYNEKQPVNKIAEEVGKSIAVIKLLLSNCGFSVEEYA